MNKPLHIEVILVFENEEDNQKAVIDCLHAKSVWLESKPVFLKPAIESPGYNLGNLGRNVYSIIVDYGDEGIPLSAFVTDTEEINEVDE